LNDENTLITNKVTTPVWVWDL